MVFSPPDKAYAMEIYDDPAGPARIELVPPPKLGGYIKQSLWEEACWDTEEEDLLLQLNAAHLRSFLGAAGVMPWEYALYSGGCAKLAGLSCHVHGYEFAFYRDRKSVMRPHVVLRGHFAFLLFSYVLEL
jgi:hypothetical protein